MATVVHHKSKYKELVSIIMPTYNCASYISKTIDSVLAQTFSQWELIIVDDASTDRTSEIVKKYLKNESRIKYFKLDKNSGAAIARNTAIDLATGEYIAFLDSDDLWKSEKLEKQIQFMKNNNYNFTCTSYKKIDDEGNFLNKIIKAKTRSDYNGILKTCPGNSTVIYNAKNLGKFKIPNIKKRNDYVMWLKVIKKENFLFGLSEPLGSHRVRKGAISSNKVDLIKYHWKVYRDIEKLSFIKSLYLVIYWCVVSVLKIR